jgi:hypothetical protein
MAMKMTGMTRTALLTAAAALIVGLLAPMAHADDWADPRRDQLENEVRRLEIEEAARRGEPAALRSLGSLVGLRHGKVQMLANLARVDLTLEIQNTSQTAMEWSRTFALDPAAEAIGASLQRGTATPVAAQTLSLEDARRIYGEVRNPRPRRRTGPLPFGPQTAGRGGGDPLRVERVSRGQLSVTVWPIAPDETVRVALTFVTPLRGRGDSRTYVDPIQGDLGTRRTDVVVTAPARSAPQALATMDTAWMVRTGNLAVDGTPHGMVAAGEVAGWLHYRGGRGQDATGPSLPLRVLRPERTVIAVPGGGLGTRVAVWYFDPIEFLEQQGIRPPASARMRLLKRTGSTSRIAPWEFDVTGEPMPVTAMLLPNSESLRYAVEVTDSAGNVLETVEIERAVERVNELDRDVVGALTGWHRAAIAARVRDWAAGKGPVQQREALAFAVDLGVLTAGTAALAVPEEERRGLSRRSRRQYWQEGAPLGAQGREADIKAPPSRANAR